MNNKRGQSIAWEREYQHPAMMTKSSEAQKDVRDFVRFYRKLVFASQNPVSIDCGCGNGRNLIYMNEQINATGFGFDLSHTAIREAKEFNTSLECSFAVDDELYLNHVEANSVDIVLDITMSPSLLMGELISFIDNVSRVLRNGGILCTRFLISDGDANAKTLCANNPGSEINTYVHPVLKNVERVIFFSEYEVMLKHKFEILFAEKQTGYQKIGNQSYKRRYGIMYAQKKYE